MDTTIEPISIPRHPGAPPTGRTSTFLPMRIVPGYPTVAGVNPVGRHSSPVRGGVGAVFPVDDLLPLLVLAIGGSMLVGPFLALVRPRAEVREGELERPPLPRSLAFMAIGLVGVVWAVATLATR